MKINLDTLNLLFKLRQGKLTAKTKKNLEKEISVNPEMSQAYEFINLLADISEENSQVLLDASKKLSKTLYSDFLKKQANPTTRIGIQVYDSSLLPLPEGVRPASVDTRLVRYQLDDIQLELSVYPITVDSVEIIGQLHNVDNTSQISVTIKTPLGTYTVDADEFQLFRFERVDCGDCKIMFKSDTKDIGILELKI